MMVISDKYDWKRGIWNKSRRTRSGVGTEIGDKTLFVVFWGYFRFYFIAEDASC